MSTGDGCLGFCGTCTRCIVTTRLAERVAARRATPPTPVEPFPEGFCEWMSALAGEPITAGTLVTAAPATVYVLYQSTCGGRLLGIFDSIGKAQEWAAHACCAINERISWNEDQLPFTGRDSNGDLYTISEWTVNP